MDMKKCFNKRSFKHGSMATGMLIAFIAVVVLINMVASMLVARFPLKMYLADEGMFVLTQESIDFVAGIDEEVMFIVLAEENDYKNKDEDYRHFYEILTTYQQYNSNISVEFKSLDKNPNLAQIFSDYELARNDIIVSTEKKARRISEGELLSPVFDDFGNFSRWQLVAEKVMTGALLFVTDKNPTTVVSIADHGCDLLALENLLIANNYFIKHQSLVVGDFDSDADIVIISAPTSDFTEAEIKRLNEFLNNNGKYGKQLFYFADSTYVNYPNLNVFLAEWGIAINDDQLLESDFSNVVFQDDRVFQTIAQDNDFTGGFDHGLGRLVFPDARSLTINENQFDVTPLVKTYPTVISRPVTTEEEEWDPNQAEQSAFVVGAAATRTILLETTYDTSNLIVFGTREIMNDSLTLSYFSNSEFLITIFNNLVGKSDNLTIIPVDLSDNFLDITKSAANFVVTIFLFIVPVSVIITGTVVFIRRRRK
ncbi:MAG: GldG family protein [Oscillospiraceae bacterium]|nr:GldG family protein [Oscillospiraceae bacterium]